MKDELAQDQPSIEERVRHRTRQQRKWRIWRMLLVGVGVTALMVFLAVLNRDNQQIRSARRLATDVVARLQPQFEHEGAPPLKLPEMPQHGRYDEAWFFNVLYADMIRSAGLVGVACPRRSSSLFLQTAGRHVILFDGRRFWSEWWPQEEFEARAASVGFGPLIAAESKPATRN